MNGDAEKLKSFGEYMTEDFQRKYDQNFIINFRECFILIFA